MRNPCTSLVDRLVRFTPMQFNLCRAEFCLTHELYAYACLPASLQHVETSRAGGCNSYGQFGLKLCVLCFEGQEQQSQWTIPDTLLRSNMKDAIAEDFLPSYNVREVAYVCHSASVI